MTTHDALKYLSDSIAAADQREQELLRDKYELQAQSDALLEALQQTHSKLSFSSDYTTLYKRNQAAIQKATNPTTA